MQGDKNVMLSNLLTPTHVDTHMQTHAAWKQIKTPPGLLMTQVVSHELS